MEKRTRVPANFEVSQDIMQLAFKHGWPDPFTEVDNFRDYHIAKGDLMLDWEAAFRTWMRNAKKFADEKAQRVYTQDPKPIRTYADRQAMPQPKPAAPLGERLDNNKIAEGLELIRKLTKKFSAGGPK